MGLAKYFLIYSVCAVALALVVYGDGDCIVCDGGDACNGKVDVDKVTERCTLSGTDTCGMYSYNNTAGRTTTRGCFNHTCNEYKDGMVSEISNNDTWVCYTCNSTTDALCNQKDSGERFGIPMVTLVMGAIVSIYFK